MKVCIICYGLRDDNVRLQPWRYICEIARGMLANGIEIKIITDGTGPEQTIADIPVIPAGNMRTFPFTTNKSLLSIINDEKPDALLWSMGPIDYLYMSNFKKLQVPIIGMFTGPIYKISDITRLGFNEISSNIKSLSVQLIYASLPSFFSKKLVNSDPIYSVFVMSRKNKEMLVGMGADSTKILHIPVGIDEYDLIPPESHELVISKFNISPGSLNILYFGSPRKIRGIDTLIKAVAKVVESHPNVKLLILSRRREKELSQEERNVFDLIEELDLKNNVQIVSGFLEREDVKGFIKFCDVVCLPFKIVPSDVPTSILESMAMGKTVISTNVDGIPELLEDGRGFVVEPNDENELASKIISCLNDIASLKEAEKKLLDHMQEYPRWNDITETVNQELDAVVSRGFLP